MLIATQFLEVNGRAFDDVLLGDDTEGVPDCFVFLQGRLSLCVEVAGYIFSSIEDLRPNVWDGQMLRVDIEASSRIHDSQPDPYTVVHKKLGGLRRYRREEGVPLILLIHSEVLERGGVLVFPMYGPMQLSPSCNHFFHNRESILEKLRHLVAQPDASQWSEVWFADYCSIIDAAHPLYVRLDGSASCPIG